MLILPLHKPLTRATFPLVTALLVIVNAWIFFGFQSGDDDALRRVRQHYATSGLAALEVPAYRQYLEQASRSDELDELDAVPEAKRVGYVAVHTLTDVGFARALEGGLLQKPGALEAWRPLRAEHDRLVDEVFTLRHILRSSEVSPWRMLSSAFLHGDVAHLIGNMLFLMLLGLLVEGALGPGRYALLYLMGAMGSSAVSLAWRWGEAGGGLGASGAIAALMGAFCVLWGRQPVRFFYWFGVVFDYVKAPAILLLPVWLGWEAFNLYAHDDMGVGFDAHIGGLVSGALLGAALVSSGQVRASFIQEDGDGALADDRWERAQAHLGRMQLREAGVLLDELAAEQPDRFDIRYARYRLARNGGLPAQWQARAQELVSVPASTVEEAERQHEAARTLAEAGVPPNAATVQALSTRWQAVGATAAAEALLLSEAGCQQHGESHAGQLFGLALAYAERHERTAQRRVLMALLERHSDQPLAAKARFLLDNG